MKHSSKSIYIVQLSTATDDEHSVRRCWRTVLALILNLQTYVRRCFPLIHCSAFICILMNGNGICRLRRGPVTKSLLR